MEMEKLYKVEVAEDTSDCFDPYKAPDRLERIVKDEAKAMEMAKSHIPSDYAKSVHISVYAMRFDEEGILRESGEPLYKYDKWFQGRYGDLKSI